MNSIISNKIKLCPRWNKANNQINLQVNKKSLPKELRDKLPKLKEIEVEFDDFKF